MSSKKDGSNFLKGVGVFRVPLDATSEAIEDVLQSLDCPRALTVWLLYKSGEHEQLASLKTVVAHYRNVESFRDAYCATKLVSKATFLRLPYDPSKVAFEKFEQFELLCKQTNRRFKDLSQDPLYSGPAVWVHNATIRKIDRFLGDFSAEEFFLEPDWGPGATTLMKRREASPVNKFQCEIGITRDLFDLVPTEVLSSVYPGWASQLVESKFPNFQLGNKIITVPKDAATDRVIAVEPGVNLWFQKSLGNMIRKRLLRGGIDLRYQSRNQQLSKQGSISNLLATVDLSSASDSIARSIVEELIPRPWLTVMDACRSHYGVRNGVSSRWEKFSSMGNGFTFELETLIFAAVCYSCCEYLHVDPSNVSVYGDDIIFPSTCYELFSKMMVFYGFRLNEEKSFYNSPFRESCGSHHYLGSDCTPVYLKDRLSSVHTVYRLANAIRRLAKRQMSFGCDARFRKAFDHLVQSVPVGLRLRIPDSLGDGGFISNFDEATPSRGRRAKELARRGYEGYLVQHLVEVSKSYQDERYGYLLAKLWAMPEQVIEETRGLAIHRLTALDLLEDRTRLKAVSSLSPPPPGLAYNSVPLSGRVKNRLVSSLVPQWRDLGPWV